MSLAYVGFGRSVATASVFDRWRAMKNSGALYRMVPVCGVVVIKPCNAWHSITRIKPKSQIRATPSAVISILL
jgi:hypothetical protein